MNWPPELIKQSSYEKWHDLLHEYLYTASERSIKQLLNSYTDDEEPILHIVGRPDIAEKLLCYGANVNKANREDETALHKAITSGKGINMVKMLIEHGANVNVLDKRLNTPLNLACSKSCIDLDIIKELLENGADIGICNEGNKYCKKHRTALDNSFKSLARTKLLIRVTLLRHISADYKNVIDLSPHKHRGGYNEIVKYYNKCITELDQMKANILSIGISLHTFFISRDISMLFTQSETSHDSLITNSVLLLLSSCKARYPIYADYILNELKLDLFFGLERSHLLNHLQNLQLHTNVAEKVILNSYCTEEIAKFLSDDSLFNVVIAFS